MKFFNIIHLVVLLTIPQSLLHADLTIPGKAKQVVIFTDYEADDSVAVALFMKHLKDNNVVGCKDFLIGTLLSNQYRKKALAQELVKMFGYEESCIAAGTGGIKEPFQEEGRAILSEDSYNHFLKNDASYIASSDPAMHQESELNQRFKAMLEKAEPNSVDALILTNPIDFISLFNQDEELIFRVKNIYMMGGWFANKPSFNWNMYIKSVEQLLALMEKVKNHPHAPNLMLFSSHFFAKEFNGYVNEKKFPEAIKAFDVNTHPIIDHLRHMVKNWDDSMTLIRPEHTESDRKWRLEMVERIGKENIGRQFAPADPATMIGYLYPEEFIVEQQPTRINLTVTQDAQGRSLSQVAPEIDKQSKVFVIEKINMHCFTEKMNELMNING